MYTPRFADGRHEAIPIDGPTTESVGIEHGAGGIRVDGHRSTDRSIRTHLGSGFPVCPSDRRVESSGDDLEKPARSR